MKRTLIAKIASTLCAYQNCVILNNDDWKEQHLDVLMQLQKFLPSGSGVDNGTKINIEKSTNKKIVFSFEFHHLNENGYYEGWTEHKLIVTPAFDGIDMRITGRNKNDIKDYLYDTFDSILTQEIEWDNVKF